MRMRIKLNELPRTVYEKLSLALTLPEIRRGVSYPPLLQRGHFAWPIDNKHFNL